MCTSIVFNGNKTVIGWNFDNPGYEYKIVQKKDSVHISLFDEGVWTSLFGAHANGTFVSLPTCHPFTENSNPPKESHYDIITLNLSLLEGRKSLAEIKDICENHMIYSLPDVTYQAQNSDKDGNVLQIFTGQGYRYIPRPRYSVMTNFQLLHREEAHHEWAGADRYQTACTMLQNASDDFSRTDCFDVLRHVSQSIDACPTQVSMVFDVTDRIVYWCENRQWDNVSKKELSR